MSSSGDDQEYRIEELARVAGTTVRNIRVYQDRELLPPPVKRGRTAIYSSAHLARLRLVLGMLERGYGFAHIKEMLGAWQTGRDLGDLLGLENVLAEPWTDEQEQTVGLAELRRLFGSTRPALIQRALDLGILVRHGTRFSAPSPRLLHAGAELVSIGVPIEEVLEIAAAVRSHMDAVAHVFVEAVEQALLRDRGADWLPTGQELTELAEVIARLRPLAMQTVDAVLAQAMPDAITAKLGEEMTRAARLVSGGAS